MNKKVSIKDIKRLREFTGAGMQDAQKALQEAGGDFALANELLRKKGLAIAQKKSTRTAKQGIIDCYIHGTKVGVIVEVNCETDFVAKTPEFKNFVHEIALQIAGSSPRYILRDEVPQEVIEKEKSIIREQIAEQKKPEAVAEKILAGKLDKFFEEVCLLEQPYIKEPKMKVSQLLTDLVAKLGENIVISRFTRYQLGEGQ